MAGRPDQKTDSDAPYGTEPRRSNTPIYVWGTLYALWLGVLVWMVFFYRSQ